ncbi:MAG: hypothetical protein G8237_08680 [Magnetococcales bacterium]|nr:hypothetical protein [Magnetococcales bacterium]
MNTTSPPRLKHRLEALLLHGMIGWIRHGSLESAYRKGYALARMARPLLQSEWAWTHANLAMIYGDFLTASQRTTLARLAFENIFYSYMESLRVHEIAFQDQNIARLLEAQALGRGVIVCGIHLGCWEPGLKRLGTHIPAPVILYRQANNPLSEQRFMELRADYGVEWIARHNTRAIVRAMHERKVMGFMTDINTRKGGVTAPFLGVAAQCPPGPARLAMRFQTPLLPVVITREAPGKATFRVGEVIEPLTGAITDERVAALTTHINGAFDTWLHEYAEQYNWLHARWRARPDGSLWQPEDLARLNPAPIPPSARIRQRLQELT